jgi:hypothetical protein
LSSLGRSSRSAAPLCCSLTPGAGSSDGSDRTNRWCPLGTRRKPRPGSPSSSDAVRALTTGIRAADGTEHRFEAPFVQILGPGEKLEVKGETVPHEMHEGMEDENRAERFVFWARFTDAGRRRWEATYDPVSRTTAGFAGTKPQPAAGEDSPTGARTTVAR